MGIFFFFNDPVQRTLLQPHAACGGGLVNNTYKYNTIAGPIIYAHCMMYYNNIELCSCVIYILYMHTNAPHKHVSRANA